MKDASERILDGAIRGRSVAFSATLQDSSEPPDYDDDAYWSERSVEGEWLADLLTDGAEQIHHRGLTIVGVRITGGLDLDSTDIGRRVRLLRCRLGAGRINLTDARTRSMTFTGTRCGGLVADRAQIVGGLFLNDGFRANGTVQLVDATIEGTLVCTAAELTNPAKTAFCADGARISGGLFFKDRFRASGDVRLVDASIGGSLECVDAEFVSPDRSAFCADGVRITGSLFFRKGFNATGVVSLLGAAVGGDLDCEAGSFTNPHGDALRLDGARVAGSVALRGGFSAIGKVRFVGASVGTNLDCVGGKFTNRGNIALNAADAHVGGNMYLGRGFVATGAVRINKISIGRDLVCAEGEFENPDAESVNTLDGLLSTDDSRGEALAADGAQVGGSVFLSRGFKATGTVRMLGTSIGGDLECLSGTFVNPRRTALSFNRAHIGANVFLGVGFSAEGEVRLQGTSIGGNLDCAGGRFNNPGGLALVADSARVQGDVLINERSRGVWFIADGEVGLQGTSVGGNLDCTGGSFNNAGRLALVADRAHVNGDLSITGLKSCVGRFSLLGVTTTVLRDDKESWPERIELDGFRYTTLVSPDMDWRERSRWLRLQGKASPNAYLHLAAVLRAAGDSRSARNVLMERHNALLHRPQHWKQPAPLGGPVSRSGQYAGRGATWVWRLIMRGTIGHGYAPWRAIFWALLLVAGMSFWYSDAARHDLLRPTSASANTVSSRCTSNYPCVHPVALALDTLVPLVDLGQRSRWTPDQSHRDAVKHRDGVWLAAATWVSSGLGWALGVLAAASFSQVIRRE